MNLTTMHDLLDALLAELGPRPVVTPPSVVIDTPDALDRALSVSPAGTVLTLKSTLRYPGPLTFIKPVVLRGEQVPEGRIPADFPVPTFLGGLRIPSDEVTLLGVDVRHPNPLTDVLTFSGARVTLDRVRVLGDPVQGAKRGIAANGGGDCQILRCHIDDIKQPAQDTQAICAWDMGPGLVIDDCYLSAAGQSVMIGGSDPSSDARQPRGVVLTNSTLTKKPEWLTLVTPGVWGKHVQQVKCALELKNVDGFTAKNLVLEYAGTSQGQGSFLIVLTPRNQGNTAPSTTVAHVAITDCVGRHAGSGVSFLGDDNVNPSKRMTDVRVQNVTFEDLDPVKYGGSGRLFYINRAPDAVTIDAVTAAGTLKSIVYFDELAPPTRLTLRNFKVPTGVRYAYHNRYGDTLASVQQFAPDAVLQVTPGDVGATRI
jgi:hypothetical protein